MHAAKRRTLIFNSSLLVCRITLRSPFLYFNVMIPLLILSKSKNYAALAAPHKRWASWGGWSSRAQRLSCCEQPGRRSRPCGLRALTSLKLRFRISRLARPDHGGVWLCTERVRTDATTEVVLRLAASDPPGSTLCRDGHCKLVSPNDRRKWPHGVIKLETMRMFWLMSPSAPKAAVARTLLDFAFVPEAVICRAKPLEVLSTALQDDVMIADNP
jgi:hypothetical protein